MSVFSDQNVIFEQEYEAVMARHGVLQTFAVHQVALNIFYHPILKYNIKIQYRSPKYLFSKVLYPIPNIKTFLIHQVVINVVQQKCLRL